MANYLDMLELLEDFEEEEIPVRKPRTFRPRINPLEVYDDTQLFDRYRFPRRVILELLDMVRPELVKPTNRNHKIEPEIQLCAALAYFATGATYLSIGSGLGIGEMSVLRSVHVVSYFFASKLSEYVRFPSTAADLNAVIYKFYDIAHIPNVVGSVDGSHVPIMRPTEDEHLFVNRKGFHSINVHCICDADLVIREVVVKWPGSSHDSFMWQNSTSARLFEDGTIPYGHLLGDSAYPIRPWLLTPLLNPENEAEENYNRAHAKTRNTIERCFGVLKNRFRCLHITGGPIRFRKPQKCCAVIAACCVLHNIARREKLADPTVTAEMTDAERQERVDDRNHLLYNGAQNDGRRVRQALINRLAV